jgi:ribonuclease HI
MGGRKKHYAVIRGFRPGIYSSWYGPGGAEEQVKGFANALYKGFGNLEEAEQCFQKGSTDKAAKKEERDSSQASQRIAIYTDGGCKNNPGPGGYGAVIIEGNKRTEISQGYRLTTNNRMELMACIAALKSLKNPAEVVLHSDSQYVVKGIEKGWAKRWRSNGWMRTKTEAAENADLWAELLALCDSRPVYFVWVRGHAGNRENKRCDRLATEAALSLELREDSGYAGKGLKPAK